MEVRYNVSGERRKEMVSVISEALGGWSKQYLGAPSFSYQVGDFEITKDGTLIFADRTDTEMVEQVLDALEKAGFECEEPINTSQFAGPYEMPWDEDCNQKEMTDEEMAEAMEEQDSQEFNDQLAISLPNDLDEHARQNLDAAIAGKATLLKEAFQTESLAIDEDEQKLTFPWFRYSSQENMTEETNAYMLFLTHLITYAKEAKRVTAKDKAVDNPRYAFRCFLLRLGFIGKEYKAARKILMQNLTGNSSFKSGHRKEAEENVASEQ